MPKLIDYPRGSFRASLALADAVWYLGGRCTMETAADHMGLKVGGSFRSLVAAASKFRLLSSQKGNLHTSEVYKLIKHAYSESEMKAIKAEAFLSPPVFRQLYEKFRGRELPTAMLSKILVREFDLDADIAGRIAGYFIDGCKEVGLLGAENVLLDNTEAKDFADSSSVTAETATGEEKAQISGKPAQSSVIAPVHNGLMYGGGTLTRGEDFFVVHISGPSMNLEVIIKEEDDLVLLEVLINKIKKKLTN